MEATLSLKQSKAQRVGRRTCRRHEDVVTVDLIEFAQQTKLPHIRIRAWPSSAYALILTSSLVELEDRLRI